MTNVRTEATYAGVILSTGAPVEVFPRPRRQGTPLRTLTDGLAVVITRRAKKWVTLSLDAGEGPLECYVESSCVAVPDADGRGFLAADPALQRATVEAPSDQRVASSGGAHEAAVARAWNLYGGLLSELSGRIGIDPAYAVAVLCVESGGQGYGADGRVIIRFENHIFRRYLGAGRAAEFNRHFQVGNEAQPWLGHAFRASTGEPWTAFHGSQALEWRAYEVARALDADAATRSISMGLPQVMGFNHALVGYDTPRALLAFMGVDVRFQLLALFDFIAGAPGTGLGLAALRQGDFDRFATLYNGPGQARYYGDLIQAHVAAFRRLKPAPAAVTTSTGTTTGTTTSNEPREPQASGGARTYEVRPGDTLGAVAGRFGVTVSAIVAANGIADPNRIFPGQVFTIPSTEPAPPPPVVPSAPPEDVVDEVPVEGHVYVVRPGDTLGAIAQRAGTTVAALASENGIANPNLIFPGQVIRTPVAIG